MWKKSLFLILAVFYINSVSAQRPARRVEITGSVRDIYNGPIANAIIMIDGVKTNTVTDARGNYRIKVKSPALRIGVFTFGNGIHEEYINSRTNVNFSFNSVAAYQLDPNVRDGHLAVNTGYGMVKKRDLTTDVTMIDGTARNYYSYSSILEMIQREVSGVQINGNEVIIQGSRNTEGYVRPLVVVDGVYMDNVPDLPPATIRSIEVLKGTSAAIYGSRGFGGAIIIKTKIQNN
jgi:TonB-dependent SusC/RagA subfamily outer membrane receptor